VAQGHVTDHVDPTVLAERQAALQRVATLVAQGEPLGGLFAAVAEEVARIVHVPVVSIVSVDDDGSATVEASVSERGELFAVGARWPIEGSDVIAGVLERGRPVRIDDDTGLEGEIAEIFRHHGISSTIGIPVVVAGRRWGAMVVSSTDPEPLPEGIETDAAVFAELLSAAVENDESRRTLGRLADEQAALRRVATLVARGVTPAEIFAAASDEVGRLFGANGAVLRFEQDGSAMVFVGVASTIQGLPVGTRWELDDSMASTQVYRTGRSARVDAIDWQSHRGPVAEVGARSGVVSALASPIIVDGRPWGAMTVSSAELLPLGVEARLERFTELLATAIASAESREGLTRLADEQAALRRVATLVARGTQSVGVCRAVCDEVSHLFGTDVVTVGRFETEPPALIAVALGDGMAGITAGSRWPLDEALASTRVFRTGHSARVDQKDRTPGSERIAAMLLRVGVISTVASPIIVEGRPWGAITVSTKDEPLPLDAEDRLNKFSGIVATSIANAESREALGRLADEQAALRRVATLVAREAPPEELFAIVAEEVARVVQVPVVSIVAYEDDGTATECASFSAGGALFAVGTRWTLEGSNVVAGVLQSGHAARINDYTGLDGAIALAARRLGFRSTVAIPIVVGGRLWGAMVVSSAEVEPLPSDTETRLAHFTELVATAISNAESRRGLARLAGEQAALRRVATLVARAAPPDELFAAVAREVGQLLRVDVASISRYVSDDAISIVALWGGVEDDQHRIGTTLPLGGKNLTSVIAKTHRPTRIDTYVDASGGVGEYFREAGIRSAVAAPIIVDDHLWGAIAAGSRQEEPLPPDSEARLADFTELVATAIANAESRRELAASRARIVTAADRVRSGIERDLHDGAQQHLVALSLSLRSAQATVPPALGELDDALSRVADGLTDVQSELLEMARGIHPAILARGGLGPAVKMLARRSPIPVEFDVRTDRRLPEPLEVATYYVVSEALTNAAKHARASVVRVEVELTDRELCTSVVDDGVGGADPARGSGLVGLKDRVEALGGVITVKSPVGAGTSLRVALPLAD
jgi:GAF domain-containing protein